MHFLRYSLKSVSQNGRKSVIVVAVSMVLVLFLTLYSTAIAQHEETLATLHENIRVTGQITNFDGSVTDNLDIPATIISLLEASDFLAEGLYSRNLCLLSEAWVEMDTMALENKLNNAKKLVGVNTSEAIQVNVDLVNYLEGYDENLFTTSERVCIASDDFMRDLNLELGDSYRFTVAENAPAKISHPHKELTLKIVGVYAGYSWQNLYCPWDIITEVYQDISIPLTWDSAGFILENTQRLPEFKELLNELGFVSPYETQGYRPRNKLGFVINDRLKDNVTGKVSGNIDFMTALYPLIYLLSAGIGFVVSFLLIRLRKLEFAIMRSLGTSRGMSFLSFFCEQTLLCFAGTALAVLATLAVTNNLTAHQTLSVVGYSGSYLAGAALAIATINRTNVIRILAEKE